MTGDDLQELRDRGDELHQVVEAGVGDLQDLIGAVAVGLDEVCTADREQQAILARLDIRNSPSWRPPIVRLADALVALRPLIDRAERELGDRDEYTTQKETT